MRCLYLILLALMASLSFSCRDKNNATSTIEEKSENPDDTLFQPFPIEAGVWFNIEVAPQPCGYYLINNQIYALEAEESPFDKDFSLNDSLIEYTKHYNPVNDVDITTFEVCIANDWSRYARDINYVYYPENSELKDFNDYDFHPIEYGQNLIIPEADPATFKYIGRGYAVDKNNMYRYGKKIEWSDSVISLFFQRHKAGLPID